MNLVKRFTPPVTVVEVSIQDDVDSPWFGYLFVKTKDGELIHAADLKPGMQEVFSQRRRS